MEKDNGESQVLLWGTSLEDILAEWSELSRVQSFLHSQAHLIYKKRSNAFAIPVIVLSTLTGFVSMSLPQFGFSAFEKNVAGVSIGLVNIGCGVLQTLSQILKVNELSHSHLQASTDYENLALDIEVELRLERGFRKDATNFLKSTRSKFEGLQKSAPIVPGKIRDSFKSRAKVYHTHLPDSISLEFEKIMINRHMLSKSPFRIKSPVEENHFGFEVAVQTQSD
jgi:hypothetical protein